MEARQYGKYIFPGLGNKKTKRRHIEKEKIWHGYYPQKPFN